ncbi:similar to CTF18, chromosome transmission fidelity factor 18 homolog isoform 3 [Ectocarpus siliculosus]|uniref:Similar to CTF18, chromosome transmission fidelity factor 18 homolog isoform 3 n=1 Tax=Ectocarpus siliculosus TaxID=2880 RepID=D7FQ00_ECTSI|nr:similar to CTF18, chromosome transmission fidelity factor 18 homolog isoform 3 [Ectocarpus siliculosus]|eukprot:CBJ48332.1 similar to CTF18, chromosome transmission fidelity factor 18 homolog isoform 3 [Ectocarpus siliculosus]
MEDEPDFDDLLADAEQDQMYDDELMMDDIEAELAMEAEASTRTPLSGSTNLGPGVGVSLGIGAAADGLASAAAGLNRNHCPSPPPLDQRLGVPPGEVGSPHPSVDEGDGDAAARVRRALNNEGRSGTSPLHPVLQIDSSSRWSGNRSAPDDAAGGRSTRSFRSQETATSGATSRSARPTGSAAAVTAMLAAIDTQGAVLSRPSVDGDSVPFMQSGGRMMHLKVRATLTTTATSSIGGGTGLANPPSGSLLHTPMATLMERVTERRVIQRSVETAAKERAAAAAAAAGDSAGEEADKDAGATTGSRGCGGGGGGCSKGKLGADGALWVDKYAPDGFRDLLSDEKINREVLRAVKAWDPFVFKKETARTGTVTAEKKKGVGGMKPLSMASTGDATDKRPEARIIMLCGPPGLGKTTLAQVVAKHAGYRVYEINASDDRTASVLRQRMTEAMEGNTLLADKRPNLIVLDEVDGADGKAAAQVLVDIATAPLAKATAATGGGKKGKRRTSLTRPLVLICNDQWTPALRPIRAIAQVFVFRAKSSPARLVQRLKAICTSERLTVNTDALTRLADRSHLDVRSCLHTLQFVARRASSGSVTNASAALLTAVAEGIKDERRDLFEVLRSVFTRKKSGTKRRLFLGGEQGSMADRKDAEVFEEVQAFNDHSKVLAGVHENFLGVRFNDPTLSKAAAAMDWLEMADLMDTRTNQTQDYSFSRYAPVAAAGVHFLCRSDQRSTVTQPKKDYEARTARAAKSNILHSFADGRQLGATGRTTQALVLDMLSHLMDILAPTLRPLNPDLLSPQERARFRDLVGILLSCGLTFSPQSASSSSSASAPPAFGAAARAQEFALEPAIDQLLKYEGYEFAHPRLAPPLRPMVAHEVALEGMRQAEAAKLSHREDAAFAKNAASDPFAAASSATRGTGHPFTTNAEKSSGAPASSGKSTSEADEDGRAAATAAAKRKWASTAVGSAGMKKTKTNKTPPPSPPATNKFRDSEKDRPAHPVPFWNRTNWISGRKDGTGSRRGAGDDASAAKQSAAIDATHNTKSPSKSPVNKLCETRAVQAGSSSCSATDGHQATAAERSKRVLHEGVARRGTVEDEGVGSGKGKIPIRYQFRAGYTNAVRRPVRMRDLL